MAWLLIVTAGLFETGFAVLLKQSAHFTRVWPTAGFAACALISFGLDETVSAASWCRSA